MTSVEQKKGNSVKAEIKAGEKGSTRVQHRGCNVTLSQESIV